MAMECDYLQQQKDHNNIEWLDAEAAAAAVRDIIQINEFSIRIPCSTIYRESGRKKNAIVACNLCRTILYQIDNKLRW